MSKQIHLDGYLIVPEDRLQQVLNGLDIHIHLSRKERGCLAFDVWQDDDQPTRLNVSEIFCDRAAFEAHQERTKGSDWYELTTGIQRHYTIEER